MREDQKRITIPANLFLDLIRVYLREPAANFFLLHQCRLELQHGIELQAKRGTIQPSRRSRRKRIGGPVTVAVPSLIEQHSR